MLIESARFSDVPAVFGMMQECVAHLRAAGVQQWDEVYPNRDVVKQDARAGMLFVIREAGCCVAAVCLNTIQPEEYQSVAWSCSGTQPWVVHRLCVHPDWQRRGLAGRLMDFAWNKARAGGACCIRLDVFTGNPHALALYAKHGFRRAGQVFFPRRTLPFDCLEKVFAAAS